MTIFLKIQSCLRQIISTRLWNYSIASIIMLNTVVLGAETYPALMNTYGPTLNLAEEVIICIFIAELTLRFIADGWGFFKKPWSIFDFLVVAVALIPSQNAFGALRAARALRVLRLISIFPKFRIVIEGLIIAIPGIAAIGAVMAIILCVFGLMASMMYGASYPAWFGNLHLSIFSLFQIMTLEGWPDIVRTIMQDRPYAWIFFVTYILIATFSVLNLFIAVIVEAMQRNHSLEENNDNQSEKIDRIDNKLDFIINFLKK
ncbi:MAG: ion transporter [Gammaproteobacteria bacterium]|nr:ion transporter [Gammaproteobacteria bacterium]